MFFHNAWIRAGATTFSVLIGEAECIDVSVKSSSGSSAVLECKTPPPEASTAEPFPVSVFVASAGLAQSDGAVYRYTDLWSALSTWGGDLPPFEGDSVVVPRGVTIQLDVSPPRLKALILEGTLEVDPAADDIELDADYIIIVGGALQVQTSSAAPPLPYFFPSPFSFSPSRLLMPSSPSDPWWRRCTGIRATTAPMHRGLCFDNSVGVPSLQSDD